MDKTGRYGLLLFPLLLSASQTVRADVSWEHRITVRASKAPMPEVRWKMFNNWSAGRHRLLLRMPVSFLQGTKMNAPFSSTMALSASTLNAAQTIPMQAFVTSPNSTASLAMVTRLDDNRFVAYSSPARQFISEPLRELLKKVRFNPWKQLEPKLANQPVPQLSEEQRVRLGAEVRAVSRPLLKNVLKIYFRELPQKRNFEGIEGRGHRLTMLINTGDPRSGSNEWARVNWEWWLANEMTGDELVRDFRSRAQQLKSEIGPSTSMWLNESLPVFWQMLPEELHRAVETVIPPQSSPSAGFGGTPLRVYFTILPPPLHRAMAGEIRAEMALLSRNNETLAPRVFEAPEGFERVPIEPQLKQMEGILNGTVARGRRNADELGMSFTALETATHRMPLLMLSP